MELTELKELGYEFFQKPTRDNFVKLIFDNVGERDNLDFKEKWIDYKKLAKIMLGIANVGKGAIVFGVKEKEDCQFEPIGLEKLQDKANIESQLSKYIPKELDFDIIEFDFSGENYSALKDKLFQVVLVFPKDECLPYIVEKDLEDNEKGTIFYRKGTKTLLADTDSLKRMIYKRIKAENNIYNSYLKKHIEQIKILYEYVSKSYILNDFVGNLRQSILMMSNEVYNKSDSFDKFILEIIEKKKKIIKEILEIKD